MMSLTQSIRTLLPHSNPTQSLSSLSRPFLLPAGIALSTYSLYWLVRDYSEYMSLGPGGPPYNIYGWFLVNILCRPFTLTDSGSLSTSDYPSTGAHPSILSLPLRTGSRARVKGIAPQRQLTQHSPEEMRAPLQSLFDSAVARYPKLLETAQSKYERHNPAVFVREDPQRSLPETARLSRGEIGHIHQDLSVHLYLSPADAKVAMDKGWAQRHRLTTKRCLFGIAPTYLLFYGPRDKQELDVLRVFLERSIAFMSGTAEEIHLS